MGFTRPDLLAVDPDKFLQKPLMERMRILGADWAENGFGSPKMVHTIYIEAGRALCDRRDHGGHCDVGSAGVLACVAMVEPADRVPEGHRVDRAAVSA
jgi:Transmembrane protein of unknown function (DUF3556)